MKLRFFRYLFSCLLLLSSAVMFFSCSSNENNDTDYVSVKPQSEYYFESEAASDTLYIESRGPWVVTGLPAWIMAEPPQGNSGDRLIITVLENLSPNERYAVLTVSCGTATANIKVTQYGHIESDYVNLGFDKPDVSYEYSESSGNVSVTYNGTAMPDIEVGSAIVLPAEYGYDIRVVESYSKNGNSLTVSTTEGNMCNLFKNISFTLATNPNATRSTAGERVFTPVSYGYRDEQGVYHELYNRQSRSSFENGGELWSFSHDFNGENIFSNSAGTLSWEKCEFESGLNATFTFDFGEKSIDQLRSIGDLKQFGYTITGNVGVEMLLNYNSVRAFTAKDDKIIRENIIKPKELLFMVGKVPVLITIGTHLGKSHSFEAKGSVDVTAGVECSNEVSIGLLWQQGRGVTITPPSTSSEFTLSPPTLEVEASVEAKVSYYPHIEVKLYKFFGPWVEPRPYLSDGIVAGARVSSDGENYVAWNAALNGGIDVRYGLNLDFGIWDKDLWESDIHNLVEKNFYNAPARITKLSPADGDEVEGNETVTAEFLVESYCPLTGEYYPCPLALVGFEAECGELECEMLAADAQGKVKVEWIPDPEDENSSNAATRAAELVERTLTASIIDKDGKSIDEAELMVKVEGDNACNDANHVHAVDLGLSVKWACCNVGATKPEEYGGYYAWGETEEKSDYTIKTYKWCNGSYDSLTKYCRASDYGRVDNKTVLEPEDDVAHVKWGGSWRMPTADEIKELNDKCSWTWTTLNGVNGCKVTGPNGNSIFLPAAGCRNGTELGYRGASGGCWSSSLGDYYSSHACYLYFNGDYHYWCYDHRYHGLSVRPVCDK